MPQVLEANRATRNELMQIPGVGPSLADKIVAHRHLNGRFRDWAALSEVPGVGEVTLEKLKAHLYFDSESPVEEMPESLEPAQLSRKSEPKVHVTLKPNLSGLIDVNSASELELQSLPGIGPVLSKRIIEERQRRPFGSIEELKRVNGIGVKKSEAIRHLIKFGP
jgi:competence protein ComEA